MKNRRGEERDLNLSERKFRVESTDETDILEPI